MKTLNQMWLNSVEKYADRPVIGVRKTLSDDEVVFNPVTYQQLEKMISHLGNGLLALGLAQREAVGIVAENSIRWAISDYAILGNGSYNVPRGCTSTIDELEYIFNHAESKIVFVEDKEQHDRLISIEKKLHTTHIIIVLDENFSTKETRKTNQVDKIDSYTFDEVLDLGKKHVQDGLFEKRRNETKPSDMATLMYTSGTTGIPKGIPLTHANIMHNITTIPTLLDISSKNKFLSILPIWHIYERVLDYSIMRVGASIWYTTRFTILKDLSIVNPTFMGSVPRIWMTIYNNVLAQIRRKGKYQFFSKMYQHSLNVIKARRLAQKRVCLIGQQTTPTYKATLKDHIMHKVADLLIYRKIRTKLGRSFITGITAGSSLPEHIDNFFEVLGFSLIEAYGLTETSPLLCLRTFKHNIPFTVGRPITHTLLKIMDEDNKRELADGHKGNIWVSGPQVMQGYYKNQQESEKVMMVDENNRKWFNTGDLGIKTQTGDIKIMGRSKDTIVLIGGENIEPEKIELAVSSSPYIEQAMVCGQDQENLTALIVPDLELLTSRCAELGVEYRKNDIYLLNSNKTIKDSYLQIIAEKVSYETGFKEIELIRNVAFTNPFTLKNGLLTNTHKLKRHKVDERDYALVKEMYVRYNQIRSETSNASVH